MKNLQNLNGAQQLSKQEQLHVFGGGDAGICLKNQCESDSDCGTGPNRFCNEYYCDGEKTNKLCSPAGVGEQ